MTAPKSEDQNRSITTKWVGATELPLPVSDFMHWRVVDERCYLTFGQLNVPPIDGPVPDGTELEIRALSRLVVSATTLRIWLPLLQAAVNALPPVPPEKK